MPNQTYNPIQGVREKGSTGAYTVVPSPSKYDWKLSDVSSPDAGRTEDGLMHKERIAQKVHIELEWAYIGDNDAQTILTAFDPEYIDVKYYDYKSKAVVAKNFYVGDRQVTTYNRVQKLSTISFNIIEQ